MHERHHRSLAKGFTWRALATLDTVLLAYIFTGSIATAAVIGGFEVITKVLWYYLHERAWLLLTFERAHPRIAALFAHNARSRSVLKAASWRLMGAADTTLISFLVTGRLAISASIGGAELFTKLLLYYFHERMWLNIRWGRHEKPLLPAAGRLAALGAIMRDAEAHLTVSARAAGWAALCAGYLLIILIAALVLRS